MRIRLLFSFALLLPLCLLVIQAFELNYPITSRAVDKAAGLCILAMVAIIILSRTAFVYGTQAALPAIRRGDILKVHYRLAEKNCGVVQDLLICRFVTGRNKGRVTKVLATELEGVEPDDAVNRHICKLATGLEIYQGVAINNDTKLEGRAIVK